MIWVMRLFLQLTTFWTLSHYEVVTVEKKYLNGYMYVWLIDWMNEWMRMCSYSSRRVLSRSSLSSLSEPPQSSPTPGTRRSTAAACTHIWSRLSYANHCNRQTDSTKKQLRMLNDWFPQHTWHCQTVLLYASDDPGCLLHKKAWAHKGNQWQRLEYFHNVSPDTFHVLSEGHSPTVGRNKWMTRLGTPEEFNRLYMLRRKQNNCHLPLLERQNSESCGLGCLKPHCR